SRSPPSRWRTFMRFPLARRVLLAATACGAVVLPVLLTPSTASADSPNASACSGLYHGSPPGSLVITTSPPSGPVLHPGDEVEVTATWDTADWPPPVLEIVPAVATTPMLPRTGADVLPAARLGALLVLLGSAALAGRATLCRQAAPRPLPAPAASGGGAGRSA